MARSISPRVLDTLAKKRGTEPILIVGIQWKQGGSILLYAERAIEFHDEVRPTILEMGVIDSTLAISLNETSDEISFKLSDNDGHLKEIIDTTDIHKRTVYIWQWFPTLPWNEKFLVFQGQINSPITWKDSDRTLEFSSVSQLEDTEVGFTLEEGSFSDYSLDDLVGKVWPECFGTTIHKKAIRVDHKFTGSLGDSVGIADFTLPSQAGANNLIAQFAIELQIFWVMMGAYLRFIGLEEQGDALIEKGNQFGVQAAQYRQKAADITATWSAQKATERSSVRIVGGWEFPRGNLWLDIGGASFYGSFRGKQYDYDDDQADIFDIQKSCHPGLAEYCIDCGDPIYQTTGTTFLGFTDEEGQVHECKTIPYAEGYRVCQVTHDCFIIYTGNIIGETAGPFFAQAGASVKIISAEPQRYIISITPGSGGIGGTGVLKVAAFTTLDTGERVLLDVPEDYYRVYRQSFGSVSATIVETTDALSKYPSPAWEDTIYVTFRSSIGPNPVNIMQYLINRYSNFGVDGTSFGRVRAATGNYPMNFCVPDRKNIFTILKELTFMARCAIFLRNGKFHLVYLPAAPTAVHTFTEDNVDTNSIEVGFTETEDLITSFTGTWEAHGAQEDKNKVILRYNIKKYGTHKYEFDYYAYNYISGVIKSMTYWIIRRGNTWKTLKFNASLDSLNCEVFDGAYLNFSHDYVSDDQVLGLIESADYDAASNTIEFAIWSGVRAGEMEMYDFAYPQNVSQSLVFPTPIEQREGNAGGSTINNRSGGSFNRRGPRSGGGLNVEWNDNDPYGDGGRKTSDKGSQHPSDQGDHGPGAPNTKQTGNYNHGSAPPPSPPVESGSINEPEQPWWIDIRKTKIYDSQTQGNCTFDTFFREISDNKLKGRTDAEWKGDGEEGEFHFKWDSEGSKFGAGTAFLKD